jgi:hypothetical protein
MEASVNKPRDCSQRISNEQSFSAQKTTATSRPDRASDSGGLTDPKIYELPSRVRLTPKAFAS